MTLPPFGACKYRVSQKEVSFTKFSFWRSCFQLKRNTYGICGKSGNAQFGKTQFFETPCIKYIHEIRLKKVKVLLLSRITNCQKKTITRQLVLEMDASKISNRHVAKEKNETIVANLALHISGLMIWGHIWKLTLEKITQMQSMWIFIHQVMWGTTLNKML